MLATLRRSLREGTPWRGLRASADQVSGSTLPGALPGALDAVRPAGPGPCHAGCHAARQPGAAQRQLLGTAQARPKRVGELTDPNPTERAKKGTKDHLAATGTAFRPRAQQQQPM